MIFEYSCPNNTPAILHHNGPQYRALFPNKKIPAEARCLFNETNRIPRFNLFTSTGGIQLGHVLDERISDKKDFVTFVTYLRLISKGVDWKNVQRYTIQSIEEIQTIKNRFSLLGLVTPDGRISKFGKDMLTKLSKNKIGLSGWSADENKSIYIPEKINKISRGDQ